MQNSSSLGSSCSSIRPGSTPNVVRARWARFPRKPVARCSSALVVDGTNIWVGAHNILKLRASDGANLGSFDIGNIEQSPSQGIAFDGTNIWAPITGPPGSPGHTVAKLRASDGQILGTFTVGSSPEAMAFVGSNIWLSNNFSNTITQLRARVGA